MEESAKIFWVVFLTVLMSIIGFAVKGTFGAVMGFLLTLLIIGLFVIWRKYNE